MPEAFAVLFVFAVAVAAYVGARVQAVSPLQDDPRADLQRLQHHRAWLERRLEQAARENWGDDMLTQIASEVDSTDAALVKTRAAIRGSS
jgi:hypothetical protein